MLKIKTFNYRDRVLDFGFVELEPKASSINVESIINNVKESLIVVDTKGLFMLDFLKRAEIFLNQNDKVLVGLTSDKIIAELKKNGVSNGFFRSTDEQFETGIFIVDKKEAFLALDVDHIYSVPPRYIPEIFNYVNHVIWSKANYEQCQGSLKKVDDARLSVVIPSFLKDLDFETKTMKLATESANKDGECLILVKEKDVQRKAKVAPFEIKGYGLTDDVLCVNAFGDNYYPLSIGDNSIFTAESFESETVGSLLGKRIWYKGKIYKVEDKENINSAINVPLDEVESFEPDFDSSEKTFNGITLSLTISIDVEPLKLDGSYALSNKYKTIQRVENELKESIAKLEKMNLDKKLLKQLGSIKSERFLSEKVKMFNAFVASKEFGVDALNNKKSPVSIINVNEEELNVPNELIGKLYTKQSKNYFATTKERIADAKKWLKENKMEAVLIEA